MSRTSAARERGSVRRRWPTLFAARSVIVLLMLAFGVSNASTHGLDRRLQVLTPLLGEWTSSLFKLKVATEYSISLSGKLLSRVNSVPAIAQSDETRVHWDEEDKVIRFFTTTNAGWIAHGTVFSVKDLIVFEGRMLKDDGVLLRIKNTLRPTAADTLEDHHYSWSKGEWKLEHSSELHRKG